MADGSSAVVIDLTGEDKDKDDDDDDVIVVPVYKIVDFSGKPHPYYDDCGCCICEQHPFYMRSTGRYCECRKCHPRPAKAAK